MHSKQNEKLNEIKLVGYNISAVLSSIFTAVSVLQAA